MGVGALLCLAAGLVTVVSLPGGASAPLTAADIYTIAGNGTPGFTADGVPATSAELDAPGGVTLDPHGNVLIADTTNNRIRVVAQSTGAFYGQSMTDGFTYTIAGTGTAGALPSTPVPAVSAPLDAPGGVALDAHGNVVIADTGANTVAVVAQSTGNFYGQSMIDGDIYRIAGTGTAGAVPSGPAALAALNAPGGVALDAHGNVVIADTGANLIAVVAQSNGTFYGVPMIAGDIYTVVGNGVPGFNGSLVMPPKAVAAELHAPAGVAVDSHGNLLIADTANNRIEVAPQSNNTFYGQSMQAQLFYTVAGDAAAGYNGDNIEAVMANLDAPKSVALDSQGNLVIADSADNRVRVVAESSATFYGQAMTDEDIYTVAGDGAAAYNGDGISAQAAGLDAPSDAVLDAHGNLVIADTGNARIRVVAQSSGSFYGLAMTAWDIYTVAGTGTAGDQLGDRVSATTSAQLDKPAQVALDPEGNLLIVDTANNRIRVVAQSTGTFYGQLMTAGDIYTVAGDATGGYNGDDRTAVTAELDAPSGVALDAHGDLVIADTGNERVRVVAETTGTFYGQTMTTGDIYTVAGDGSSGFNQGDGIQAVSAELDSPGDVAVDHQGNVVIADTGNERIRVVADTTGTFYGQSMTAGNIYTVAGDGTAGYTADAIPAPTSELFAPGGVSLDAQGNVLIADTSNDRVRVAADTTGTFYGQFMTAGDIYTVAGDGVPSYNGDGIAATSAELQSPGGVTSDAQGNLVIADTANNRIRVVASSTGTFDNQPMTAGDIYTVAGTGAAAYNGDGIPAVTAALSLPNSVALDGQGNIDIADTANNRVREVAATSSATVPGAPMALVATASSAQVTLSWAAPTSSGGSPITGYDILRGTAPQQEAPMPVASAVSGTTYTYTDTGVTSGTTYYYEVEAVNAVGLSAPSNESSATPTPPLTVPGAPTALTATAASGQVSLSWAAPTSAGSASITGYDVLRGTTSQGEAPAPVATDVSGTTFTDTGLTNGTTYYYEVEAANSVGASAPSNEASATPPTSGAVPGAPTALTATAASAQVTLGWAAPTSAGSAPVTGYDVLRGTTAQGESSVPVATDVSGTTFTDTGLTNGTTYYYEVEAVNAAGSSAPSNEASATPPSPPPALAPTVLTSSLSGGGQSGASLSVPAETPVVDQASLSGLNAASAGGTVTYSVDTLAFIVSPFFSGVVSGFGSWGWLPAASGGTVAVTGGSVPASNPVTLGAGTYFWQAQYSGDAANAASQTALGSEQELVLSPVPTCPIGFIFQSVLCLAVPPLIPPPSAPAAASGYDLVGEDGGVFVFPTNQSGGFFGSLPGLGVTVHDIVGMVPSHDDRGYFLVGRDGGVFAFGDAPFLGSLPGLGVSVHDIRGIVPTSDDRGYFLVGQDGGVFAFGDAPFLGSLPGRGVRVNDIIGIAATPTDLGYWLVAANGQVYAFGDASQLGSALGTPSPVSGISSTPDGGGYWIVTEAGGVYTFGDARSFGSLPADGVTPFRSVIGLVPTADDGGYWLIGGDGGVFAFGDAPFVGSLPGLGIHIEDVVGAVPTTL